MTVDPGLLFVIAASLPILSGLFLFLQRNGGGWRGWLPAGSIGLSAALSITGAVLFLMQAQSAREQMQPVVPWTYSFTWLHLSFLGYEGMGNLGFSVDAPGVEMRLGYHIDALAVLFFLLVTSVALCISLCAVKAEATTRKRYDGRAGLCFLTGLILHLVLADNLIQVFIILEMIGLVLFFSRAAVQNDSPGNSTSIRPLIYHLVGDAGFLVAIAILWTFTGTLSLVTVREEVRTVLGNVVLEDGLPKRRIDQLSITDALRTPIKDTHDDPFNDKGAEAGQWCRVELVETATGRKKLELSESGSRIVVWNQETLNGHFHKPERRRFDAFDPHRLGAHGKGLKTIPYGAVVLAGLGLLLAALCKSAQWPLSCWLPETLAGCVPACTAIILLMTVSGIYLLARVFPVLASEVLLTAAYLGMVTALYGVTCALGQQTAQGWYAFTTLSQGGLCLAAMGLGGWSIALLHTVLVVCGLILVVLTAAAVVKIRQDGKDLRKMPLASVLMLLACASLVGVPLLPGWFSRDGIVAVVLSVCSLHPVHSILIVLAVVILALNVISMVRFWRLLMVDERTVASPGGAWQRWGLVGLAGIMMLLAWLPHPLAMNHGWLLRSLRYSEPESVRADGGGPYATAVEQLENGYFKTESWLRPAYEWFSLGPWGLAMILSLAALLIGSAWVWIVLYRRQADGKTAHHPFLESGWHWEALLTFMIARPVLALSKALQALDMRLWDGITWLLVRNTLSLARAVKMLDDYLFDRLPGQLGGWVGGLFRRKAFMGERSTR